MAHLTNKDKAEFAAYLRNCTDAQVAGVRDREHVARRHVYESLAVSEAFRRGISLPATRR